MYYHSGCAQPQSPYSAAQVAWAQAHAGQAHVYGPPTPPHGVRREVAVPPQGMSPQALYSADQLPPPQAGPHEYNTPVRSFNIAHGSGSHPHHAYASPMTHFGTYNQNINPQSFSPGGHATGYAPPGFTGHSATMPTAPWNGGQAGATGTPSMPTPSAEKEQSEASARATEQETHRQEAPEGEGVVAQTMRRAAVLAKAAGVDMPTIHEVPGSKAGDESEDPESEDEEATDPSARAFRKIVEKLLLSSTKMNAHILQETVKAITSTQSKTSNCVLSTKEIESYTVTAAPDNTRAWVSPFKAMITAKVGASMSRLLALPLDECSIPVIDGDDELREADKMLKMALYPCISRTETDHYARALLRRLKDDHHALNYGLIMFTRVQACQYLIDPGELATAVDTFKKKIYFTTEMSVAQIVEAGAKLKDDLSVLPLRFEPDAGHKWLLAKMPEVMHETHRTLERELLIGQAQGMLPWSFDVLVRIIATAITADFKYKPEAHAADGDKKEEPPARGTRRCTNCGKRGHGWSDCKIKCNKCESGFCPRARSITNKCFLEDARPGDTTKNAIGDKLSEKYPGLLRRMQGDWDRAKEAKEAAAAEESYDDEDDEEAEASAAESAIMGATKL
jgi:hypothetical protein